MILFLYWKCFTNRFIWYVLFGQTWKHNSWKGGRRFPASRSGSINKPSHQQPHITKSYFMHRNEHNQLEDVIQAANWFNCVCYQRGAMWVYRDDWVTNNVSLRTLAIKCIPQTATRTLHGRALWLDRIRLPPTGSWRTSFCLCRENLGGRYGTIRRK